MESRIDQLAQKVHRLEQTNRKLGRTLVVGFAVLGIVCLAGFAPITEGESPDPAFAPGPVELAVPLELTTMPTGGDIDGGTIMAERFVLVDQDRRPRAELKMGRVGAVLSMKDEKGRDRLRLTTAIDSSSIMQFDEAGKSRAMLRSDANGSHFHLADEDGRDRMLLTLLKSGPKLILNGEGEQARTGIAYFGDSGVMRFDNANGQVSAILGTDEKGAVFVLTDSDGKVLYSAQDGTPLDK